MLFSDVRHLPATDDTEIQLPELRVLYRWVRPITDWWPVVIIHSDHHSSTNVQLWGPMTHRG